MKIEEASKTLDAELRQYNWYIATGIAGDSLYVYTTKTKTPKLPSEWEGFVVIQKKSGRPKPATT